MAWKETEVDNNIIIKQQKIRENNNFMIWKGTLEQRQ